MLVCATYFLQSGTIGIVHSAAKEDEQEPEPDPRPAKP